MLAPTLVKVLSLETHSSESMVKWSFSGNCKTSEYLLHLFGSNIIAPCLFIIRMLGLVKPDREHQQREGFLFFMYSSHSTPMNNVNFILGYWIELVHTLLVSDNRNLMVK